MLTSIDLPDNRGSYQFEYAHDQGFLTKVILPSGGYIEYAYIGGNTEHDPANNYVVQRRVSPDGNVPATAWTYSRASGTPRIVTEKRPDDTVIEHTFNSEGYESQTRWLATASATTPAKIVERTYNATLPYEIVTTIGGLKQHQLFSWSNNRLGYSTLSEWYPASGAVANLTRTDYTYVSCTTPPCNLNFPSIVELKQWNGSSYVTAGKTEFLYNEYTTYPLVSRPTTVTHHHAPIFPRWNVTTINRYYDSTHYVSEHFQYDELGNIVQHTDARGKTTAFDFTDNYNGSTGNLDTFAYPKGMTNAEGHDVEILYNFDTGLPVSVKDPRNLVTTFTYDAFDRPLVTTEPNGRTVTITYDDDSTPSVTEEATVATGVIRKTETTFDKLYRPVKAKQFDPAGEVFTEIQYDVNGRVKKVSAPYRSGAAVWTETAFDELDRPTLITNPDSSTVTFAYGDNTVTITDESGITRRETRNALGQLTKIEEGNPTLATPVTTKYSYEVFGPLARVTQGSQTRSFTSDWLGRLLVETHPETLTTSYGYDSGGLLTSRTDARNITTSYSYDDIGRLLTVSYNDSITPTVTRTYDQNGYLGFLTTASDGAGSTTFTYKSTADLLASEARTFTGVSGTFTTSYNYDLEGKFTSITYPSGRQVTHAYAASSGITAGQLASITDNETSTTLVSGIGDNAAGQVIAQTLGNGAEETRGFNSRSQLTSLDTTRSSAPVMDMSYDYGMSNNGRIRSRIDGLQPEHSVSYGYDPLQRLSQATGANAAWSIAWGFDRWGNRTSQTPSGWASGRVGSPTIGYIDNKNIGYTYDAAGNVTDDGTGGHNYVYDGENRLIQVDSSANQYFYDAEGRRVKRVANSVTTYYLYGITGLMSEFTTTNTGVTGAASGDRHEYRVGEQTGTAVLLMNSSGLVVENNRVFPYGELWSIPPSSNNQDNFTTYQRDAESGNDYAMARYYASRSGRFMTPDPGHVGANVGDPQSWNAYAYVGNDPINFIDPDGLCRVNGVEYPDGGPQCPDITSITVTAPRPFGGGGFDFGWWPSFDEWTKSLSKYWDVFTGDEARSHYLQGVNYWAQDHRTMTKGLSPFPTTKNELAMAVVPFGLGKIGKISQIPLKAINFPSWNKVSVNMQHIAERHMTGGALTKGRDVFVGINDQGVMAAIRQAYGSATTVRAQGDRVLLSGTTKTGMTVEMWFNHATNMIETAYPVGRR